MSDLTITVEKREGFGRGKTRRLRAQGLVPAVIYGKEGKAETYQVVERDFLMLMRALGGLTKPVKVQQNGTSKSALIQQTQRNPITDHFEHIDFLELEDDREVTVKVPIHPVGEAFGVRNEKGVMNLMVRTLEVRCLPKAIPEKIDIDVTDLKKAEGIQIGKLTPPEGCKFTGRPDVVVIIITK